MQPTFKIQHENLGACFDDTQISNFFGSFFSIFICNAIVIHSYCNSLKILRKLINNRIHKNLYHIEFGICIEIGGAKISKRSENTFHHWLDEFKTLSYRIVRFKMTT